MRFVTRTERCLLFVIGILIAVLLRVKFRGVWDTGALEFYDGSAEGDFTVSDIGQDKLRSLRERMGA